MAYGNNSIAPVEIREARPAASDEVPIREETRAEERQRNRRTAAPAQTDSVAQRHNLYTADRRFPAARVYYSDYQQKQEVMRAKPGAITTRFDDRQTVAAMLDLAQSRGWQTIRLRGNDEFRREAWVQAQVRGMKADGYSARNTDLQEVERRKAAAAPVAEKAAPAARAAPGATKAKAAGEGAGPTRREKEKAVWNAVETRGKEAREQEAPKPTETASEKPAVAAA
nr:LPD7 domain-containing protein [uncultured Rhodopila sp.]